MSEMEVNHEPSCTCLWCEQKRLHDYYYNQGRKKDHSVLWVIGTVAIVLIFLGTAMSWFDPNLNFPVVSQMVCSFKGATWYDGGLLGPPGCYRPH